MYTEIFVKLDVLALIVTNLLKLDHPQLTVCETTDSAAPSRPWDLLSGQPANAGC